jgi:hypothetical protein
MVNVMVVMKHPLDCNPCSRMWALLIVNQIICHKLLKWLNLVKLSIAMALTNVENERCFSMLFFMKKKLKIYRLPISKWSCICMYKFVTFWKPSHLLQLSNLGTNIRIKRLQMRKKMRITQHTPFITMKNRVCWNHITLQLNFKKQLIYNYYVTIPWVLQLLCNYFLINTMY